MLELTIFLTVVSLLALTVVVIHKRWKAIQSIRPQVPVSTRNTRNSPERVNYRTLDGRADYAFSFEQQPDSTWRAYIEGQPGYGRRASDAHTTHRLSDGPRKYVCWTTPLQTLAEAKKVAAKWADATQQYIRSGKKF